MNKTLALKDIRLDGDTQQRDIDDEVVKRYAALMAEGAEFPPVEIVYNSQHYFLWDGFHRWHARRLNKATTIEANIRDGTQRDAIFLSFSANVKNAYPRQPGTVKKIIEKILADSEWSKMSMRQISKLIGTTERYVRKIKEQMETAGTSVERSEVVQVQRGDKTYQMRPSVKPIKDFVGRPVPEPLRPVFARADEIKSTARALVEIVKRLDEAKAKSDSLYHYLKIEPVMAWVNDASRAIKISAPYAVCPYCGGDGDKTCKACVGVGWIPKMIYRAIPPEIKGQDKEIEE